MRVSGFAPKTSKSAVIDVAIRLILAGGRYLPPRFIDIATLGASNRAEAVFKARELGLI